LVLNLLEVKQDVFVKEILFLEVNVNKNHKLLVKVMYMPTEDILVPHALVHLL
jgi:hypothetical protein